MMQFTTDIAENFYLDMDLFLWIHDWMAKVVVAASTKHQLNHNLLHLYERIVSDHNK